MPAEAGSPQQRTATSPSTPEAPSTSTSPPERQPRAARGKVDPNHAPFTGYLERDALRQSREKGRRWTLVISIAVHVVVFASLLVYSLFQVDELWSPSVEVKLFSPAKLPPGVKDVKPVSPPKPAPPVISP
jgi:hypothetical protein